MDDRVSERFGYFEPAGGPPPASGDYVVQDGLPTYSMHLSKDLLTAFSASAESNPHGRTFSNLMSGLADFVVWAVKSIVADGGAPDDFLEVLLQNIELNYVYTGASPEDQEAIRALMVAVAGQMGKGGLS